MPNQPHPPSEAPWAVYTDRAKLYARYRLDYAPEAVEAVVMHTGLTTEHAVADIGAGTGKLARHFLDRAKRVYCVEPNDAMRTEAVALLGKHAAFVAISGCAECTSLADQSVYLITTGMADDWFEPRLALTEFRRILVFGGWVALFRYHLDAAYMEKMAAHLVGLPSMPPVPRPGKVDPGQYLAPGYQHFSFPCTCWETWGQFIGGALAAAGAPSKTSSEYDAFTAAYRRAFTALSEHNAVRVHYCCTVAVGQLCGR